MASFNDPKLSNHIADDVPAIKKVQGDLARLRPDDGNTDYPNGTVRKMETAQGYEFQSYNGTAWVTLEKWNLDVQKVDGYSASTGTTASTIPVRDANGKLPGDITGNAASADEAKALSETNPIAAGGTGATTAEQARANLGTPPKNHAASSTEYGAGSSTQYGHLKSHDEPDATLTAASGHAFSPAGAASLKTELEEQIEEIETGASTQLSTLDSTLRALIAQEVAKCLKLTGGVMTGILDLSGHGLDQVSYLEMMGSGHGGIIDFRYNGANVDYTSRIIEDEQGHLGIDAPNGVTLNHNAILTSAGGTLSGLLSSSQPYQTSVGLYKPALSHPSGGQVWLCPADSAEYKGGVIFRSIDTAGNVTTDITIKDGMIACNGYNLLSIVASWYSGADWYVKFSNGLIMQGGYQVINGSIGGGYEGTHTFGLHIPFNTRFYSALINCNGVGVVSGGASNMQTTHFTGRAYGAPGATRSWLGSDWIAIGY